ncbi:MAG: MATE family efflux transporter [Acidobacteriota bacterium]
MTSATPPEPTPAASARPGSAQAGAPTLRRQVLSLAIPASLESVFQMSFGFVDQVVIGRLGEVALAAVGLTNQMVFLVTLVLGAVAATTAILVAQAHGRGDADSVSAATGASFLVGAAVAVPIALVPLLAPAGVLRLLGAEAEVVALGAPFIQLVALTLPMALLGTIAVSVLRSLGDAKTPMVVTFGAVGTNTVLNLILVFGLGPIPALGVLGAAYATVATHLLRLGVLVYCMVVRQPHARFELADFVRVRLALVGKIARLTSPIALTEIFWALGAFLYTLLVVRLGTTALAANQVVLTTEAIFIMCSSGLSVAALTLIGQSIGAGDLQQLRERSRYIVKLGVASAVLFGLLLALATWTIELLYPKLGGEALRWAVWGLLIMAVFQPSKVLNMILGNGVLRAGADNRFVLGADLVSIYVLGLPLAFGLAIGLDWGLLGVFVGKVVEETARAATFLLRLRTSRWHRMVAGDGAPGPPPSNPDVLPEPTAP